MAVKQNNADGNGSSADANQSNGGSGVNSTGTITKSKKMNSNGTNSDGGGTALVEGISLGSGVNTELPGCSGSTGASSKNKFNSFSLKITSGAPNANGGPNSTSQILKLIDFLEMQQQRMGGKSKELPIVHQHLIVMLARVKNPGQLPDDLKRFKEDMAKVSSFFFKYTEKSKFLYSYLEVVCELITMPDGETPSCALAVIFQLFNSKIIEETVNSLLKHNVPDQNIRKAACLLCEWLRICSFCQNLHVWIMAILTGLQERNKTTLVEQIALENIEHLFHSLMLPFLRPKVAGIVFYMLSSIDQKPEIFHKILPKFPIVINQLEKELKQSSGSEADSIEKILQQLVSITSQLMARFYRYDHLYDPIEYAIKGFQPSNSFDSSAQNASGKVGLVNLGNTCYMNSVLQALAMTKEFSRELLLSESKSPLLIKMQQQIALMLYSTRHELTPSKVLNATRPPGFSPGLQQDSSEFLGFLLETLHEQEMAYSKKTLKTLEHCDEKEFFNKNVKKADNQETGASALYKDEEDVSYVSDDVVEDTTKRIISTADDVDSIKSTNLQTNHYPSLSTITSSPNILSTSMPISTNSEISTIEKTFTGKLATTYKCLTCGWKSCNIDSFRDLQLSFPDVKNDCASNYSVQDLIEYYCSSEKLYGDNKYFCERCKKLSDAERYINVISAPKNLILTLKHFKYDQKYHMRAKLMHKVFHDEKVSLKVCAPESLEEIATVHYDLYAGVVHSGFSMDSGHYYTYAADATNKWYKFNDSIVTPSKTEELHNLKPPNTPYILFYQMGARSNETPETSASTKVIKVDVPTPLTLDELPSELRDMVAHDNSAFSEELKIRRYKNANSFNANVIKANNQRRDSYEDDDEQPPPASGCGGNAMNINMNRFVY